MNRVSLFLYIALLSICAAAIFFFGFKLNSPTVGKDFRVIFLDVDQGDAVFIETPRGFQILVDGGRGNKVLRELGKVMPFYDRSIDVVVATHYDADHIGGLLGVIDRYDIGTFITNGEDKQTNVAREFDKKIKEEGSHIILNGPLEMKIEDDISVKFIWPLEDKSGDSNGLSIVMLLENGDTSVLLTGDAPSGVEASLLEIFPVLLSDIDVLKVGHHGSKTSSGRKFLEALMPRQAVISAGINNSYGHPHKEVLSNLEDVGAEILYTYDGLYRIFLWIQVVC